MPGVGSKIFTAIIQTCLLPIYGIAWLLGSPYLMTLLCIMSEILVELVVSTVMAGVSLIVSAVILIEEDPRPLNDPPSIHMKSLFDSKQKSKFSSTKRLGKSLRPVTSTKSLNVTDDLIQDSFFDVDYFEGQRKEIEGSQKSAEGKQASSEETSQKSLEPEKKDSKVCKDSKKSKDRKESTESQESKGRKESTGSKVSKGSKGTEGSKGSAERDDSKGSKDSKEIIERIESKDSKGSKESQSPSKEGSQTSSKAEPLK